MASSKKKKKAVKRVASAHAKRIAGNKKYSVRRKQRGPLKGKFLSTTDKPPPTYGPDVFTGAVAGAKRAVRRLKRKKRKP